MIGFEDSYEVSSDGQIRSVDRVVETRAGPRRYRGRVLRLSDHSSGNGRKVVVLSRVGVQRGYLVAPLVAEAFLGPNPGGTVVRHLNDDPSDDSAGNLAYGTYSDNMFDKVRNGHCHETAKALCPRRHELAPPNVVASFARRGHRSCLACARARANQQRHPEIDFVATADEHYRKIMR